jgi:tripartite-type tricarboxylate transporter receptor subunit TctC
MHFKRLITHAGLLGAFALAAGASLAQEVPASLRLLVGYAAGGPVDAAARLIAPALAKELGAHVIVENKPGANATLAGHAVVNAPLDGSLLWFAASPTITISPNVMDKMPFDPARDLAPVAPVLSYYNVLVINKDLPFKSLKELTSHAAANPGKITYGSAGFGGSNHLCGELFAARTGTQLTHVPYKGNAPAMTDVIGGQLTMMFDIIGSARAYIDADRVRPIAVTSPRRNASLPDVPTMAEAGVAGFDVGGWYGVYGPPKMAPALIQRYNDAVRKALADPEVTRKLDEMGYELWTGAPSVLAERGDIERAMWAGVTKGMKVN